VKSVAIFVFVCFSVIIVLPSFAQSSSQSDNCPQGTKEQVKGLEIICVPINNIERTCPSGTYQGRDNQGNFACRDIKSNQIVDPNTGIMTDSQTGQIILNDEEMTYVGVGILVFIIIIGIIVGISRKKSESTSSEPLPRRGWTDSQHKQVLNRQDGKCARCGEHSGTFQFDHKDDNHNNNDLDNCQALCPNCHDRKSRGLD